MSYRIIETEDGLAPSDTDNVADVVVDPGPYDTYEEALEALGSLQNELDPTLDSSGVPAGRALESRGEPDSGTP